MIIVRGEALDHNHEWFIVLYEHRYTHTYTYIERDYGVCMKYGAMF